MLSKFEMQHLHEQVCRGSCADLNHCACGTIGRVWVITHVRSTTTLVKASSMDKIFAVTAIKTKRLGK
jgi:hypothetical protein